jgi:hypothetical protein
LGLEFIGLLKHLQGAQVMSVAAAHADDADVMVAGVAGLSF